jgi:glycosyltransferase involved in cell wall biosynthesis
LNHEILTTGAHLKRKGFEYLIMAMPSILKEYPDARLHILSDGPRRGYLEGLTRDFGLKSNVVFHGYLSVNELLSFYKNCRVFCHPSLSEGFCHTTLEAMASGRPVVSTDTNGSEMVEHNKTGFVVPTADSEAISDAILRIFDDNELTYKMGINARSTVENEYDWHKIAKKYYEIYCKLGG